MNALAVKVLATFVATIVVAIAATIGVKKSNPLMVLVAVSIGIPTVLFGFPTCLRALAVLIAQ